MDLGAGNADWVSLSGELHLAVVHCGSCSSIQSVTSLETDFASAAQLQVLCACTLCLPTPLVDSGGIAQAVASLAVKVCASLRTEAQIPDVAAAARGCRFHISTTSQVVSEPYQRFPKTEGRIVSRKQRTQRSDEF